MTQTLTIGAKYKVTAQPDEEHVFTNILVNGKPVDAKEVTVNDKGAGIYVFTMQSSILSISATFSQKSSGEQDVEVDDNPEGGTVLVEASNE